MRVVRCQGGQGQLSLGGGPGGNEMGWIGWDRMRGLRGLVGLVGTFVRHLRGWGWVPYVAGGVAPDSFICWVGYLCVRKASKRGPWQAIPTRCELPVGPVVGRSGICVGEPCEA